ncbi:SIS domain-containing protein [Candidatus Nitrosopelagicus sp.]|nr:SIS domain-containing protein [Candidatus Nitrosopelagicus sp.]|tara:strand:+ start:258 stop:1268 length:1011 start_codon:yes stop_codon:yes gene_type:complete
MNLEQIDEVDTEKMYRVYDKWYEIAKQSYEKKFSRPNFKEIDHVVFVGMGGSGTIGDIFSSILSKKNIHTTVVKGYLLPETVDSNTLVVVTSVSGNTKETLTILENSLKTEARVIAMSSGGKMEEMASGNNGILYFKINKIHSPRASLLAFLYSTLNILEELIPIEKSDIIESLEQLEILQKEISSMNLSEKNSALELAKWINEIPIIYYPAGLHSAAIRFKNSLQENSKNHVIIEDVIETCHNGIVAWEKPSKLKPILIQGTNDYVKTKERWSILEEFFQKNNVEYKQVFSNEGNILTKIVCLIYFFDYVSIYHAILSKIDPSPVSSIDYIKKKL